MVSLVSDGLDLGGRGCGVYGVWAGVVGLWRLRCLMVWTWVVGAMVSMVSVGVRAWVVGLWCLWCLMVWTWAVGAMVSMVSEGGRGYNVYGVWGWSGCGVFGV